MELEKVNKNVWFCDSWKDFVEYHSICYGYLLVFKYQGNSNFNVLVFDKTTTEIQYPLSMNCKLEGQADIMELEDANISMHHKNDNEMSNSNELAMKHVEAKEKFVKTIVSRRSSKGKFKMSRGRERAIQAARMFKPKNPSFIGIIRHYNMSSRYMVSLYT